jgi:hypothetical protein
MKRPALKRLKKPPTPQQLRAGSPQPSASADPPPEAFAPIAKKRGRVRGGLGRVGGGLGRAGGRLGRVVTFPLRKLGGLQGRARLIVWGVLAVIVVILALQLRGGRDDALLVREALSRYETASAHKDYQTLCDELFASSYVRQTASNGLPCEVALRTGLENVQNPKLEVISVEVNGDRAAARVRGSASGQVPADAVYTLVREDGQWRILPPRPKAPGR